MSASPPYTPNIVAVELPAGVFAADVIADVTAKARALAAAQADFHAAVARLAGGGPAAPPAVPVVAVPVAAADQPPRLAPVALSPGRGGRPDILGGCLRALAAAGRPVTGTELAAAVGLPSKNVHWSLERPTSRGLVARERTGVGNEVAFSITALGRARLGEPPTAAGPRRWLGDRAWEILRAGPPLTTNEVAARLNVDRVAASNALRHLVRTGRAREAERFHDPAFGRERIRFAAVGEAATATADAVDAATDVDLDLDRFKRVLGAVVRAAAPVGAGDVARAAGLSLLAANAKLTSLRGRGLVEVVDRGAAGSLYRATPLGRDVHTGRVALPAWRRPAPVRAVSVPSGASRLVLAALAAAPNGTGTIHLVRAAGTGRAGPAATGSLVHHGLITVSGRAAARTYTITAKGRAALAAAPAA